MFLFDFGVDRDLRARLGAFQVPSKVQTPPGSCYVAKVRYFAE